MKTEAQNPEAMLVPWYVIVAALVVFHVALLAGLAHVYGKLGYVITFLRCNMDAWIVLTYLALLIFLLVYGSWLLYRTIRRSL